MPTIKSIVNLDALIKRADLATPGEASEDISAISVLGLAKGGMLYPALRKPDFQRETASWGPEEVADLIVTFARRDLIPAVILWRAGQNVFVIDGAHRLSALIAWLHDDYGDGEVSRPFFHNAIPEEQLRAAQRTRELVETAIGSFKAHQRASESPREAKPDVAERAARIGWQDIPVQWIRNADHDKAEKSFFRINQGGTKIDPTEKRILNARGSATALAARAILRAGSGHSYWEKFGGEIQNEIERLGGEIYKLLFDPVLNLPHKSLDVPMAGQGYGPHVLPILFDLINLVNDVSVPDSSNKRIEKPEEGLEEDIDGRKTVDFLKRTRAMTWRLCSNYSSSLGLHPALYFYTQSGVFQPTALLAFVALFRDYDTPDFKKFTQVREKFEEFLMAHRGITEAVRQLGSGSRSRPRVVSLYKTLLQEFEAGTSVDRVYNKLKKSSDYGFLFASMENVDLLGDPIETTGSKGKKFTRDVKGAAFLRDALPSAHKCASCKGLLHRNGMQTGHDEHRRDGGSGRVSNAKMQHPFCNSTMYQ